MWIGTQPRMNIFPFILSPLTQPQVNAFLDALGKDAQGKTPEPHVVVIEGAHGTGKVSTDACQL